MLHRENRKSGNRTAYEGCVGSPLSHKLFAKNEAGSPKLGASTLARKLDSMELRERKIHMRYSMRKNFTLSSYDTSGRSRAAAAC
jgi:hypothetical protein